MTHFPTPGYTSFDNTAPDTDVELTCPGCKRLTLQVSNQPIYVTFGVGIPPLYGQPEPYLPTQGQLIRNFDAYKIRARTPTAQLPAGTKQAHVFATPLPN